MMINTNAAKLQTPGQVGSSPVGRWDQALPRLARSLWATFTDADVRLLAHIDTLQRTLSEPAIETLMERAYALFGAAHNQRLGASSVEYPYNLRKRIGYRRLHQD